MVFKLQSSKVGYIETEIDILHLEKFKSQNSILLILVSSI